MEKKAHLPITIQPFKKAYESEVTDLIVGIQQDEFGIPITASDQPDLMNIPNFYQNKSGNFWVAICGRRIVGSIALLDIGNRAGALRKMFVAAPFRGNGTGTSEKLLKTLLSWSKSKGIKEIFLGTTQQFLAAHKFYEKNGFSRIPRHFLPDTFPIMKVDSRFYKLKLSE